jgi:hypothetical protein
VWINKFETLTNKEYNRAGRACGIYRFFRADLPDFINSFIFYYLHKGALAASFTYKVAQENIILFFDISKQNERGKGLARLQKIILFCIRCNHNRSTPDAPFGSGIF